MTQSSAEPRRDDPPPSNQYQGSIRLGRFFGTEVYIHWTWFLAAYWLISTRDRAYSSVAWNVAEYLAGFAIVTLHEFGHVLACKSVGGTAERVLLWPMGGLAFVDPPRRPGACLWTTVAGPLVNVILVPILIGAALILAGNPEEPPTDAALLAGNLAWFNLFILIFNLLPIFPMDGGRILQAVLWWFIGQGRSLAIAAVIGILACIAGGVWALSESNFWLAAMAAFLGFGAYGSLRHARRLRVFELASRREELHCPVCGESPPAGRWWMCLQCREPSDLFHPEPCSAGGAHHPVPICPFCMKPSRPEQWLA